MIITIDTPVYNITDQSGFIGLVREAVNTVNEDNAFMTLIDYDNIELVLPVPGSGNFKATPMLCCHNCPEGHAYKLGNCGESLRILCAIDLESRLNVLEVFKIVSRRMSSITFDFLSFLLHAIKGSLIDYRSF